MKPKFKAGDMAKKHDLVALIKEVDSERHEYIYIVLDNKLAPHYNGRDQRFDISNFDRHMEVVE